MAVSIKIPEEDLLILSKMKNSLRERNIKVTQKDLIDKAIKFSMRRSQEFIHEITSSGKMDRKEAMEKFFADDVPRIDFGDNWLEEIDTTL